MLLTPKKSNVLIKIFIKKLVIPLFELDVCPKIYMFYNINPNCIKMNGRVNKILILELIIFQKGRKKGI